MKGKSIKFAAMTIQQAKERLLFQLYHLYDDREARTIADWVLEHVTGWKKIDRVINRSVPLNIEQEKKLELYTKELSEHRPVQYVLGEAWFQGYAFYVNEHTLIPRPETEELVEWIKSDIRASKNPEARWLLDIGTGSGCIPISLKKAIPQLEVISCDISDEAIAVARKNADKLQTTVQFEHKNMLDPDEWLNLPPLDLIVSNPPYIPQSDASTLQPNVLHFEPHIALFVPDNDPLVFYRVIAEQGKKKLKKPGYVYLETHEQLAGKVAELFRNTGYTHVEIRKDMQEKERMVKAQWS